MAPRKKRTDVNAVTADHVVREALGAEIRPAAPADRPELAPLRVSYDHTQSCMGCGAVPIVSGTGRCETCNGSDAL